MYWFKGLGILFLTIAIAGCGFHPLYSTKQQKNNIRIDIVTDENVFSKTIGRKLEKSFLNSDEPKYIFKFTSKLTSKNVSIKSNGEVARKILIAKVNFFLLEKITKKTLLNNNVAFSQTFDQDSENHLSNLSAEQSAKETIIKKLAELLKERIVSFVNKEK